VVKLQYLEIIEAVNEHVGQVRTVGVDCPFCQKQNVLVVNVEDCTVFCRVCQQHGSLEYVFHRIALEQEEQRHKEYARLMTERPRLGGGRS